MIYKNKGSPDDYSKYRAIGPFWIWITHLRSCQRYCYAGSLQSAQHSSANGKRASEPIEDVETICCFWGWGYSTTVWSTTTRRVWSLTYIIDYTTAFDSISHKCLNRTLTAAKASRKSREIFRVIYKITTGIARVRDTDGKYVYSGSFQVRRGVIQGDIISSILFILALDQLVQTADRSRTGVKYDSFLRISVLGYGHADDTSLAEPTVEAKTERLTNLTDASERETDMKINVSKTMSQHVYKRKPIKVTESEVARAESKYKHQCAWLLSKEVQDRQSDAHPSRQLRARTTTARQTRYMWLKKSWESSVTRMQDGIKWNGRDLTSQNGSANTCWSGINATTPYDPFGQHRAFSQPRTSIQILKGKTGTPYARRHMHDRKT